MDGRCECEAEHGDSPECEHEQQATCPLCLLNVCLECMEGDEAQHACTVCSDAIHVAELPECEAEGHSHRATWLVAISTSSPVVRLYVCPQEYGPYQAQGYRGGRLIRVTEGKEDTNAV